MFMLKTWWCLTMPWHKWVKCEPVSEVSDKLTCSCGREYGMNNHERIMLPWDQVAELYVELERIRRIPIPGGGT